MEYSLLVYLTPDEFAARTDPQRKAAFWGSFFPYVTALSEAGVLTGGVGLEPPESGATVRIKDGRRMVQDGPYADTKEQLAGFLSIRVPDLDTALDWAARYPAGAGGVVEVRPNLPPAE